MVFRVSAVLGGKEEMKELCCVGGRGWDKAQSETAVGCGTFGHHHGERGKPGWITASLGREKGSWPFRVVFSPFSPPAGNRVYN